MTGIELSYRFLESFPEAAPVGTPLIIASDMDLIVADTAGAGRDLAAAGPSGIAAGDRPRLPHPADFVTTDAYETIGAGGEQPARTVTPVLTELGPWHQVAALDDTPVLAVALTPRELDELATATNLARAGWRDVVTGLVDIEQALLGRGMQMARWYATSRFCSACATPTEFAANEPVARCPSCGHVQYPRLAPAMIVAVIRDRKILLGRSPRFRGAFHSVLAGFVEPGESVEDCIHREVCEEAGIEVKNIRYFGSQSWPMPHSLMLGYIADWAAGEISIDDDELEHADWYAACELPNVPGEVSIAGRMIRWFRENYS